MFTDKAIKGLKPKLSSYRFYEKAADKGFGVKVTPAGSKSFFVQYAVSDGQQKFYNLGRYPSISLSDARDRCREIRHSLNKGLAPDIKTTQKFGTVADLFTYYVKCMASEGKRSWQRVEADLNFNCEAILHLPAKDITPLHIRKILHAIISRGSSVQANRIRSYLGRAFRLGVYHDNDPKNLSNDVSFQLTSNPVDAIPKDSGAEVAGDRNLTFTEIKQIWHDPSMQEQFQIAIKLMLLYGCRTWELCGALKAEFDFENMTWVVPPERVKNNRWLVLPITPYAKELFDKLWLYSGNSKYLFPGRFNEDKPINKTSLAHAVRRITVVQEFTLRDLRRTVKTRMGEIGIEKSIRDRIQNHALTDVSSKHYDRYDYLPEKRAAIFKWENHLLEVCKIG
ncbi:MAG: integrase arm-type DNA-binding domain-containing protein [Methyloglobulus sp.]|nr:integrase arm-type DNA-binding domain-containing protein [Methyloglobulus sp.]